MNGGEGQYYLSIFYFDLNGNRVEYVNEEFIFSVDPEQQLEPNTIYEARTFVDKVNTYLAKSISLVCYDNGEVIYSTNDNPVIKTFDINW